MLSMARFLLVCWVLLSANLVGTLTARKLGNRDYLSRNVAAPGPGPGSSPSESLRVEDSGVGAQEPVLEKHHRHHHSSVDKSIAGGLAILGCLAVVFLVAVFCYIRATRRRYIRPGSPTDTSTGRKSFESGSVTHP